MGEHDSPAILKYAFSYHASLGSQNIVCVRPGNCTCGTTPFQRRLMTWAICEMNVVRLRRAGTKKSSDLGGMTPKAPIEEGCIPN